MSHQDRRTVRINRALFGLVIILSLLSGCRLQGKPQEPALSIKIDSPASGMEMRRESVTIQSTATDPGGVSWIELWVDGELMETTQAPTPLQPKFSAVQHWQATIPGEHLIEVRAYDEKGTASPPANIILRVSDEEVQQVPTAVPQKSLPIPTATLLPTVSLPTPTSVASACERDSKFVEDVTVPDDTRFAPGAEFEKTWRVLNTGTCSWGPGFELVFVKGEQMKGPDRITISETDPQAERDISVTLVAPEKPGTYRSDWQLRAPHGELFGAQLYVKIIVEAPVDTPEPTATVTLTATSPITATTTPATSN